MQTPIAPSIIGAIRDKHLLWMHHMTGVVIKIRWSHAVAYVVTRVFPPVQIITKGVKIILANLFYTGGLSSLFPENL